MSEASPYSFENLTHSGIAKFNSREKDGPSLSIDVFNGNAKFAIFIGKGSKPFNLMLPGQMKSIFVTLLRKIRSNPAPVRESIGISDFNQESKKMESVGHIALVVDDDLKIYWEVAHRDLNGRHIFQAKMPYKFDLSQTSLSAKEIFQSMCDWMIQVLTIDTAVSERVSGFKRQQGGGNRGGGSWNNNRSGGGGYQNNNSGGGYGGGGNRSEPPRGSTFDTDDDLAI